MDPSTYVREQGSYIAIKAACFALVFVALLPLWLLILGIPLFAAMLYVDYVAYAKRPMPVPPPAQQVVIFRDEPAKLFEELGKAYIAQCVVTSPPSTKFINDNAAAMAKILGTNPDEVRKLHTESYRLCTEYFDRLFNPVAKVGFDTTKKE